MVSDFLIVGGGIAGVSAAAALSEIGQVDLIESEANLGYHASGRSAAMFVENYGNACITALNRASRPYLDTGFLGRARGVMLLVRPQEMDQRDTACARMGMQPLSSEAARERVPILRPDRLGGAGFFADALDIDTDLLLQSYARAARANGARLHTGTRLDGARRLTDRWLITTSGQNFEARTLVNAAGAWADEIARLANIPPIGLTPRRRSIACLPAPGDHDIDAWPLLLGMGESWYARPDAGRLLVSPADTDAMAPHDAWADDMVLAEGLARYEAMVTTPVTRLIASWAGLRSFAPDDTLVLGPAPYDPQFLWCAGQGGYGFQTAPAAATHLADLAAGRPSHLGPELTEALSAHRFSRCPHAN